MLPQLVRMSLLKREAVSQMEHFPHLALAPQTDSPDELAAVHAELEELAEKLAEAIRTGERDAAAAVEAQDQLRSQLQAAKDAKSQLQQKLSEAQGSLQSQQQASQHSEEVKSIGWCSKFQRPNVHPERLRQ